MGQRSKIGVPLAEDEKALEAIRANEKRLWRFIRNRIADQEEAEDVLQDVFAQIFSGETLLDSVQEWGAWLFTVARNKIFDRFRRRRTQQENADGLRERESQRSGEFSGEVLLRNEIAEALDELPEDQRNVFTLHELEGKSFEEIAQITGAPLNTLLSKKRYAILALRKRLKEVYDELDD